MSATPRLEAGFAKLKEATEEIDNALRDSVYADTTLRLLNREIRDLHEDLTRQMAIANKYAALYELLAHRFTTLGEVPIERITLTREEFDRVTT